MAQQTPMQELTAQLVVDNVITQQEADQWIYKEKTMIITAHYGGQVSGKNQGPTEKRGIEYYESNFEQR